MNSPNNNKSSYLFYKNILVNSIWLFLLLVISVVVRAQEINPNGENTFYYPNGRIASEGYFKDGLPSGIWRNYYSDGTLKSIGKKEIGLSDSLWVFYDSEGRKTQVLDYYKDKKFGCAVYFDTSGNRVKERFYWDDIPQEEELDYHSNGALKKRTLFVDGKAEGKAYEYDTLGLIITEEKYDNGYLKERQTFNRYDENGKKTGVWRTYFPNGNLETEMAYQGGIKNGLIKSFDKKGKLIDIQKMQGDSTAGYTEDIVIIDLYRQYYPSGNQKLVGGLDNGLRSGIYREYDEQGIIINGYIYERDTIIAEGIIKGDGVLEGEWKYYNKNGVIIAKGAYVNSKKDGKWVYYFDNGKKEQEGIFKDNQLSGEWNWYYANGQLRRKEFYNRQEQIEGTVYEYDSLGNEMTQGDYYNGVREGYWVYDVGDFKEVGSYSMGLEDGVWKHYYKNGKLSFIGEYSDGEPKGKHVYYHLNGLIKEEGKYLGGEKHGNWYEYNNSGEQLQVIEYKRGEVNRIDGFKVEPISDTVE